MDAKIEKKSTKRKRGLDIEVSPEALNLEMKSLFSFYEEVRAKKYEVFCVEDLLVNSLDLAIAGLIEESRLPLSKLVEFVFKKVDKRFGGEGGVSLGVVKSKVISIGQRSCYGVVDVDADVLEDDCDSALWCWETRELKLMPKSIRNLLKIRRTCRKKIHERIMALASMTDLLKKSQFNEHCQPDMVKASEKLGKMLNEEDIRKLVESMSQKNDNEMADKDANHGEKLSIKQLEKNKREAEKEKKRATRELQKEKLENEKELKRLQDEAEKEARRREKEERKQLKKQQEELEKDQQRKEREKTELKLQASLQKQASLMERFLKKAKTASTSPSDQSLQKATLMTNDNDKFHSSSVTQSMDNTLSLKDQVDSENLWRCHLNTWRPLRHSRKFHWSIRKKPKRELVKELKLSRNPETCHDEELNVERAGDGWVDQSIESTFCHSNSEVSPKPQMLRRHKQLLQFDKTNRPAFYGFWPKESQVIKARRPFAKDPDLDYEIDSDDEWEEEDPGESLSDCDKEEEDETLEEGCSRGEDEEDSEDGFFVPDGYLSEDEGVEVEKVDLDKLPEGRNSPSSSDPPQFEDLTLQLRQQKYLRTMTEHALRKNQPLVILNLTHEKASLLLAEDLTGADKIEQMCLQALSMCAFPDNPAIDISLCNNMVEENQEACSTPSKTSIVSPTEGAMADSDVPQIIAVVQSNSQGISKIIEALQLKFPNTSKSQLKNKVREIADFSDNRWQVKKDVLVKFGLSPETARGKNRSVATFFSKRCQPPGKYFNPDESSPQSAKSASVSQLQQQCSTSTDHV